MKKIVLWNRSQMERVIRSRIGRFNVRVIHAQKENSLSYCVNAFDLCRSERAIIQNNTATFGWLNINGFKGTWVPI